MKTNKIILLLVAVLFISTSSYASFVNAKIKVTGVTCSMCSNSVYKALTSLKFVEKVDIDLENTVFEVTFKKGERVVIDDIRSKIEGAGFSVGELIAGFKFEKVDVSNDYHYSFGGDTYHFVNVKAQNLNAIANIRFVDKGLTSSKEHKKYVGLTTYACIKTGKSDNCCHTSPKQRIYHVTL